MYHDPELGNAMSCLGMAPELVAVPNLITLCAEQLPMDVCMQVWDLIFAFGPAEAKRLALCVQVALLQTRCEEKVLGALALNQDGRQREGHGQAPSSTDLEELGLMAIAHMNNNEWESRDPDTVEDNSDDGGFEDANVAKRRQQRQRQCKKRRERQRRENVLSLLDNALALFNATPPSVADVRGDHSVVGGESAGAGAGAGIGAGTGAGAGIGLEWRRRVSWISAHDLRWLCNGGGSSRVELPEAIATRLIQQPPLPPAQSLPPVVLVLGGGGYKGPGVELGTAHTSAHTNGLGGLNRIYEEAAPVSWAIRREAPGHHTLHTTPHRTAPLYHPAPAIHRITWPIKPHHSLYSRCPSTCWQWSRLYMPRSPPSRARFALAPRSISRTARGGGYQATQWPHLATWPN